MQSNIQASSIWLDTASNKIRTDLCEAVFILPAPITRGANISKEKTFGSSFVVCIRSRVRWVAQMRSDYPMAGKV